MVAENITYSFAIFYFDRILLEIIISIFAEKLSHNVCSYPSKTVHVPSIAVKTLFCKCISFIDKFATGIVWLFGWVGTML